MASTIELRAARRLVTRAGQALVCAAGLLALAPAGAAIYTCVDGSGRRITSDRPIMECMDREQRVLNDSGTLRQTVPPSLTGNERAIADEKSRREALERQRQMDERNRLRALSLRFPNQAVLDRERAASLAPIDAAIQAARQRQAALEQERRGLEADTRPAAERSRALEQNAEQLAAQQRFVADKLAAKEAMRLRFADMQRQLEALWVQPSAAAAASAASAVR